MKIYNTMTRSKEDLVPMVPGEIRMYSCGVTVYDLSHVGHARMMIVFDVIARYLRFAGYRVTFVRNFTDIEDKIIRRANQEGVPAREISERYVAAFGEDIAALGVEAPDVEPKATDHVPDLLGVHPDGAVLTLPARPGWEAACPRRFRYALVVGLTPTGARVQPVESSGN